MYYTGVSLGEIIQTDSSSPQFRASISIKQPELNHSIFDEPPHLAANCQIFLLLNAIPVIMVTVKQMKPPRGHSLSRR
jgi:hypothetical protein